MACLAMHLAIAKKYLEINPNENNELFIKGAYLPDIAENATKSHYGKNIQITSVKDMLDSKIDIVKCASEINLNDNLNKAIFLHLLTDFLFYNFVYNKKIENMSPDEVRKLMYQDYDFTTNYIIKNYQICIPKEISHKISSKEGEPSSTFFANNDIDNFINLISKLNLDLCKKQILKDSKTFLTNFLTKMGKKYDNF